MKHLDEGTIHSWLDGALSAAEARDAESHVASCGECSAKVAEARGLIAGASRILTALDDVPSVVPKRAPSTAPAVRQWRAAPWVTGIAATLMLAIGITTYTREEGSTKPGARVATLDSAAKADLNRIVVTPAPSAPAPATTRPVASVRRDEALGSQARRTSVPRQSQVQLGSAGGVGVASGSGAVQDLASSSVSGRAAAQVAPAPVAATAFKEAASADAVGKLVSTSDVAGCYPVVPQPQPRALAAEVATTAAKAAEAQRRRVAPAGAPTAAMNRAAEEPVQPPLPTTVLLDTTRTAQGLLVRSPATRVALGFWDRFGSDSVRVNLLMHGVHTIATNKRANCP